MDTQKINALFTSESLLSLQGAALVSMVVPNVLTYLIGPSFLPYEKWLGFGIAMLLALMIATRSTERGAMKWIVALLNGFLIFSSAAGMTEVFGAMSRGLEGAAGEPVPFFHSWFK